METEINITSAKYQKDFEVVNDVAIPIGENLAIVATIDGVEMLVPLDESNQHYAAIMRQVEAGTLVISEADA